MPPALDDSTRAQGSERSYARQQAHAHEALQDHVEQTAYALDETQLVGDGAGLQVWRRHVQASRKLTCVRACWNRQVVPARFRWRPVGEGRRIDDHLIAERSARVSQADNLHPHRGLNAAGVAQPQHYAVEVAALAIHDS